MEQPERVLVRATNWIGDAVMSLPALREVRRLFPTSFLALLAKDWVADIYRDQGLVDRIISFRNRQSSFRTFADIRGFDLAVLFQNAFEAAFLVRLAGIPERVGYQTQGRGFLLSQSARPRIKRLNRHQAYYYLDLLYQTKLSPIDYLNDEKFQPNFTLKAPEAGTEQAKQLFEQVGLELDRDVVGINAGAYYGPAKRWLVDRYASLADQLIAKLGLQVALFGSQQEIILAEKIREQMTEQCAILAGRTDLSSLLGAISLCRLFVTNDSGPMHLAAALETPLVAIFGSTDEIATGPLGERATVIHKHVECSPCLRRECPIDLRCFTRIEVSEVMEAVRQQLGRDFPLRA
jgi:heptosyltransferase-2